MIFKLIKNTFSFETFFVLFLFSSQFKNVYPFSLISNITLLLTIILIPWSCLLYRKRSETKFLTAETGSFLLFSMWCLVGSFWVVPHTPYSISKALCFGVYTIPSFFMAYCVIGSDQARLKRFLYAILIFSFLVHFDAYKEFVVSNWHIVDVLESNYLVTGQTLGVGFILLVLLSFFNLQESEKNGSIEKTVLENRLLFWFLILLCGTYAYIQLHLGGRGPVLGVILTLLCFYMYGACHRKAQLCRKHFLYVSLTCVGSYLFFDFIFDTQTCHFLSRINKIISPCKGSLQGPVMDESLGLRLEYYKSATSTFLKHPIFGVGFGGWAQLHDILYHYVPETHDLREVLWRHPHNIALEVLAETGLLGGLLGAWFGARVLKKIDFKRLQHSFLDAAPVLLLFFSFFNALKSGDLNDNILFFVMTGIVAAKEKIKTECPC